MSVTIFPKYNEHHEINMCNSNFITLWESLGLNPTSDEGTVGSISADKLWHALYNFQPVGQLSFFVQRIGELLNMCELFPSSTITWG